MNKAHSLPRWRWREYTVNLRPGYVQNALSSLKIRTALLKTGCWVNLRTNAPAHESGEPIKKQISIIRINGPNYNSIAELDTELEQILPTYRYRQIYRPHLPASISQTKKIMDSYKNELSQLDADHPSLSTYSDKVKSASLSAKVLRRKEKFGWTSLEHNLTQGLNLHNTERKESATSTDEPSVSRQGECINRVVVTQEMIYETNEVSIYGQRNAKRAELDYRCYNMDKNDLSQLPVKRRENEFDTGRKESALNFYRVIEMFDICDQPTVGQDSPEALFHVRAKFTCKSSDEDSDQHSTPCCAPTCEPDIHEAFAIRPESEMRTDESKSASDTKPRGLVQAASPKKLVREAMVGVKELSSQASEDRTIMRWEPSVDNPQTETATYTSPIGRVKMTTQISVLRIKPKQREIKGQQCDRNSGATKVHVGTKSKYEALEEEPRVQPPVEKDARETGAGHKCLESSLGELSSHTSTKSSNFHKPQRLAFQNAEIYGRQSEFEHSRKRNANELSQKDISSKNNKKVREGNVITNIMEGPIIQLLPNFTRLERSEKPATDERTAVINKLESDQTESESKATGTNSEEIQNYLAVTRSTPSISEPISIVHSKKDKIIPQQHHEKVRQPSSDHQLSDKSTHKPNRLKAFGTGYRMPTNREESTIKKNLLANDLHEKHSVPTKVDGNLWSTRSRDAIDLELPPVESTGQTEQKDYTHQKRPTPHLSTSDNLSSVPSQVDQKPNKTPNRRDESYCSQRDVSTARRSKTASDRADNRVPIHREEGTLKQTPLATALHETHSFPTKVDENLGSTRSRGPIDLEIPPVESTGQTEQKDYTHQKRPTPHLSTSDNLSSVPSQVDQKPNKTPNRRDESYCSQRDVSTARRSKTASDRADNRVPIHREEGTLKQTPLATALHETHSFPTKVDENLWSTRSRDAIDLELPPVESTGQTEQKDYTHQKRPTPHLSTSDNLSSVPSQVDQKPNKTPNRRDESYCSQRDVSTARRSKTASDRADNRVPIHREEGTLKQTPLATALHETHSFPTKVDENLGSTRSRGPIDLEIPPVESTGQTEQKDYTHQKRPTPHLSTSDNLSSVPSQVDQKPNKTPNRRDESYCSQRDVSTARRSKTASDRADNRVPIHREEGTLKQTPLATALHETHSFPTKVDENLWSTRSRDAIDLELPPVESTGQTEEEDYAWGADSTAPLTKTEEYSAVSHPKVNSYAGLVENIGIDIGEPGSPRYHTNHPEMWLSDTASLNESTAGVQVGQKLRYEGPNYVKPVREDVLLTDRTEHGVPTIQDYINSVAFDLETQAYDGTARILPTSSDLAFAESTKRQSQTENRETLTSNKPFEYSCPVLGSKEDETKAYLSTPAIVPRDLKQTTLNRSGQYIPKIVEQECVAPLPNSDRVNRKGSVGRASSEPRRFTQENEACLRRFPSNSLSKERGESQSPSDQMQKTPVVSGPTASGAGATKEQHFNFHRTPIPVSTETTDITQPVWTVSPSESAVCNPTSQSTSLLVLQSRDGIMTGSPECGINLINTPTNSYLLHDRFKVGNSSRVTADSIRTVRSYSKQTSDQSTTKLVTAPDSESVAGVRPMKRSRQEEVAGAKSISSYQTRESAVVQQPSQMTPILNEGLQVVTDENISRTPLCLTSPSSRRLASYERGVHDLSAQRQATDTATEDSKGALLADGPRKNSDANPHTKLGQPVQTISPLPLSHEPPGEGESPALTDLTSYRTCGLPLSHYFAVATYSMVTPQSTPRAPGIVTSIALTHGHCQMNDYVSPLSPRAASSPPPLPLPVGPPPETGADAVIEKSIRFKDRACNVSLGISDYRYFSLPPAEDQTGDSDSEWTNSQVLRHHHHILRPTYERARPQPNCCCCSGRPAPWSSPVYPSTMHCHIVIPCVYHRRPHHGSPLESSQTSPSEVSISTKPEEEQPSVASEKLGEIYAEAEYDAAGRVLNAPVHSPCSSPCAGRYRKEVTESESEFTRELLAPCVPHRCSVCRPSRSSFRGWQTSFTMSTVQQITSAGRLAGKRKLVQNLWLKLESIHANWRPA
ncbi:unnamed protein product [Calicophoron daubneyi]|uniref:Uncharacterized protein n=1 Tax=Calicophoron daubneyi TaxID=300641 RepID=A0AAV2TQU5_CALDB